MTGVFKIVLVFTLVCITTSGFTQQIPLEDINSNEELPRNFYANQTLNGVGNGLLFMGVGVGAGYLLTVNDKSGGFARAIAVTLLGVTGYAIGIPIGIHGYGKKKDYKGNGWATVGGMIVGGAVGGSIASAIGNGSQAANILAGTIYILAMPVGGVLGYNLTRQKREFPTSLKIVPTGTGLAAVYKF